MSRSAMAQELGILTTLWRRDLLRLRKERTRWLGVVLQPLMLWAILGLGIGRMMTFGSSDADYLEYFFPGIVVMVVLFTSIFATISIIEDRREGFLQQVLVAPGSSSAMVLGKIAGVVSLTLIQSVLLFAFAPIAGYSLGDVAWVSLLAAVVLSTMGLTAMNIAIAWKMTSVQGYHAIMSLATIPLWMLSGALFPVQEGGIGLLMKLNPVTYMVSATRSSLGGDAHVALSTSLGLTAAFAVVTLLVSAYLCRRK
jgi:daunorubicin resistance ABC transporter membrane protein